MKFVTKSVNWTASIVRCFADSAGGSVGTLFRCSFFGMIMQYHRMHSSVQEEQEEC